MMSPSRSQTYRIISIIPGSGAMMTWESTSSRAVYDPLAGAAILVPQTASHGMKTGLLMGIMRNAINRIHISILILFVSVMRDISQTFLPIKAVGCAMIHALHLPVASNLGSVNAISGLLAMDGFALRLFPSFSKSRLLHANLLTVS
jgi:hypothetical protein